MGARHSWRATALVACVAAAVSGCSTEETLPRAEYTAAVNRLCAATAAQIDAALIPVIETYIAGLGDMASEESGLTDEQVMGLYRATRPVAEDLSAEFSSMLSEIRALPPPNSDASTFAAHWERVETLWNEAYESIVAASADPTAARSLLAEPDPRMSPTNEAALTLGIEECVFD
ncbi:MAG TPA: hypothetical protein VK960_04335 [Acidimicrobiia bacterium]|nr:hypothetical protein [Acidimicrobiia bacterium]